MDYMIDVDFVMSKRIQVCNVKDENEARETLERLLRENPYDFASKFDAYVTHEITDITEDE